MPTILGEDVADTEENGSHQRVVVRETVKTIHVKAFCQKPFQVSVKAIGIQCHLKRCIFGDSL